MMIPNAVSRDETVIRFGITSTWMLIISKWSRYKYVGLKSGIPQKPHIEEYVLPIQFANFIIDMVVKAKGISYFYVTYIFFLNKYLLFDSNHNVTLEALNTVQYSTVLKTCKLLT